VADRSSPPDGRSETIRYNWSGTPGAPLTRQYNGGAVIDMIDSVQTLEVQYEIETVSDDGPPPDIEELRRVTVRVNTDASSQSSGSASAVTMNRPEMP
jgi:hypothetical protein